MSPVPLADRTTISVATADLTGSRVDSLFRESTGRLLARDYFYAIGPGPQGWSSQLLTLTIVQNPFRLAPPGEVPRAHFSGDLEIAQYGPTESSADVLFTAYTFFGLGGVALASAGSNAVTAGVQYRFTASGLDSFPSILIRAARNGDVRDTSRRQLMVQLADDAAGLFIFDILREMSARGLLKVSQQEYIAHSRPEALKVLQEWTGIEGE
jgi:hypothetical protein